MIPRTLLLSIFLLWVAVARSQNKDHITVDGLNREFLTYLPAGNIKTDQLPLIISLHGNLGTPADQFKLTDLKTLADQEHFMVICPAGIDRSWNDGRPTKANSKGVDDVKFIDQLITYAIKTYHADAGRIYVTGMSNGGFMTSRIACELSNRIAAAAVVSASMDVDAGYLPQKPLPVMYIQGSKDPFIPFLGGVMKRGAGGNIYSHADVLKQWAEADHCNSKPGCISLPTAVNDGTTVLKEEYINPATNIKVIGYTITNGGHAWPGGFEYLPKIIIGITTKNLDASQVIWNFFKDYRIK